MENSRIKFLPGKQRLYLQKVRNMSALTTNQLAAMVNIHPRSFRDWENETLTMSYFAAIKFSEMFNVQLPEDEEILISRWKESKIKASSIGGRALFSKYGSPATVEGRRKGGVKGIAVLRARGVIPILKLYNRPNYSKDLAEFTGIMLGDGGLTKGQCTITLNGEADVQYIPYVINLSNKLFGEAPKVYKRRDSKAIVLYYNSVSLVRYLQSIGLKVGNKVLQQVSVPEWILTKQTYKLSCLKGLMDTDGGIFKHSYMVNGKQYTYQKLCFSNRSIPLLQFVYSTLTELECTPKMIDKVANKKVWLYNMNEVKLYLEKVGTENKRLIKEGGPDGKAAVC